MKFLKCLESIDESFVEEKLYKVLSTKSYNGEVFYDCIGENGLAYRIGLEGYLWQFEEVEITLEQMYFNLSKNMEAFHDLIQAGIDFGGKPWNSVEHYMKYVGKEYAETHVVYFDHTCSINGVDSGDVAMHKPDVVSLYEVSGEVFLEAYKEHFGQQEKPKKASPRYHRKRKPVPKRTVNKVVLSYTDGSTYMLKNVERFVLTSESVEISMTKEHTKGIIQGSSVEVDTSLLLEITIQLKDGTEYGILTSTIGKHIIVDNKHLSTRSDYFTLVGI